MKVIEVIADAGFLDTLIAIAEQHQAVDTWFGGTGEDGRKIVRILVRPEHRQAVMDSLQSSLGGQENARINVIDVEVTLPRVDEPPEQEDETEQKRRAISATREELYNEIEKGARFSGNHMLLVFLSTIVASIGLLEDNVAVVVGAMVIAPLLGPNIALAFATSLGDRDLVWASLKTNLAGLGMALGIAIIIGAVLHVEPHGQEILTRTGIGPAGVVLALASGAAAVISLTTGVSTALVGVMVAVALLPPTATLGLMLGSMHWGHAAGAGLLLAINIVCVNLAAKLVFLYRGVRPRTWLEKRQAKQSVTVYVTVWVLALVILLVVMYLRERLHA
ncbi:MAG: TIGR00341 family protein [Thiogranum sp.]|nr:TIGR00341 family protein [Thiogranum sp.]